jgi:hypothetical protein
MKRTITTKLGIIDLAKTRGFYLYTDTRTGVVLDGALFTVELNR